MQKQIIKSTIAILLVAIMAMSLVSCGKVTEDEAVSLVKDLVSRSYDLNVVYYGEGIKYKETGNSNSIYLPAAETEKFMLKTALILETRAVFSETLAGSLIDMSFNGIASEINQNSVQSRYIVYGDDDWIYVNKDYEPVVDTVAKYDYNSIKITKISRRFIEAEIYTTDNKTVEITLINEMNGWRLDSITC